MKTESSIENRTVSDLMMPSDVVRLRPLIERTEGRREITVSVIDGPVSFAHSDFSSKSIRFVGETLSASCLNAGSIACTHGTLVMGMLAAKRTSGAPALCPGCTFIVRPIFRENAGNGDLMPFATPKDLSSAIVDSVSGGANVINLSVAVSQPSSEGDRELSSALDYAAARGVLVAAAAGNQGMVASSAITRHPWVIPVVGCDLKGRPTSESNLGASIGRSGLAAPGENISSIGPDGKLRIFRGTSAATPFVTGAIALLWSEFPGASAVQIRFAVTRRRNHRKAITPPLLDAWAAYQSLRQNQ